MEPLYTEKEYRLSDKLTRYCAICDRLMKRQALNENLLIPVPLKRPAIQRVKKCVR